MIDGRSRQRTACSITKNEDLSLTRPRLKTYSTQYPAIENVPFVAPGE